MGFSREEMEDKLDEIIQFADIGILFISRLKRILRECLLD